MGAPTTFSGRKILFAGAYPLSAKEIDEYFTSKKLPLASSTRTMTGTITASGATITGVGTKFLTELAKYKPIKVSTVTKYVIDIASDTVCTVDSSGLTAAGVSYTTPYLWYQLWYDEKVGIVFPKLIEEHKDARHGVVKLVLGPSGSPKLSFVMNDITAWLMGRLLAKNPAEILNYATNGYIRYRENIGFDLSEIGLPILTYRSEYDASNQSDVPKLGTGADPKGELFFCCTPEGDINLNDGPPQEKIPLELRCVAKNGVQTDGSMDGVYGGQIDLTGCSAAA
jgi:hypothetical protein